MLFSIRPIHLTACLAVMLLSLSPLTLEVTSSPAVASALLPEVRLRKIHLVRPDLIPYPISYEIDC